MTFQPQKLTRHADFIRFEDENGLEYEIHGDEAQLQIAFEFAESITPVLKQAESLLSDFMKHDGTFSAEFVEFMAIPDDDGGVCRVRHSFIANANPHDFANANPHDFGYTYFDVVIAVREPPNPRFWPIKFVVGFW